MRRAKRAGDGRDAAEEGLADRHDGKKSFGGNSDIVRFFVMSPCLAVFDEDREIATTLKTRNGWTEEGSH